MRGGHIGSVCFERCLKWGSMNSPRRTCLDFLRETQEAVVVFDWQRWGKFGLVVYSNAGPKLLHDTVDDFWTGLFSFFALKLSHFFVAVKCSSKVIFFGVEVLHRNTLSSSDQVKNLLQLLVCFFMLLHGWCSTLQVGSEAGYLNPYPWDWKNRGFQVRNMVDCWLCLFCVLLLYDPEGLENEEKQWQSNWWG